MLHQTQDNAQNAVAVFYPRIQSVYALHTSHSAFVDDFNNADPVPPPRWWTYLVGR